MFRGGGVAPVAPPLYPPLSITVENKIKGQCSGSVTTQNRSKWQRRGSVTIENESKGQLSGSMTVQKRVKGSVVDLYPLKM